MVVIGDGSQRTGAMSGCHGEIAISQRRVAPRSAKSAAMTVARRSCKPRGVPMPNRWRMTPPRYCMECLMRLSSEPSSLIRVQWWVDRH